MGDPDPSHQSSPDFQTWIHISFDVKFRKLSCAVPRTPCWIEAATSLPGPIILKPVSSSTTSLRLSGLELSVRLSVTLRMLHVCA